MTRQVFDLLEALKQSLAPFALDDELKRVSALSGDHSVAIDAARAARASGDPERIASSLQELRRLGIQELIDTVDQEDWGPEFDAAMAAPWDDSTEEDW